MLKLNLSLHIISFVVFTQLLSSNAFGKEAEESGEPVLQELDCETSRTEFLQKLMFDSKKKAKKAKEDNVHNFKFKWIHTSDPVLINNNTEKSVKIMRHSDSIDFSVFHSPSYAENFEYKLGTQKISYTQIFKMLDSPAQFYVAEGICEPTYSD